MQHSKQHLYLVGIMGLVLLLVLAGCGSNDEDDDNKAPDMAPVTEDTAPTVDPADRAQIQAQFENLSTAQQTLAELWRNVDTGPGVPCSTELPLLLSPEAITQAADPPLSEITALLRSAAIDLDRAMTLWSVECETQRTQPPDEIVREGRNVALSAGDALREAGTLLDALP
jgi:hypothetical protein